jgi:hypothetical protein
MMNETVACSTCTFQTGTAAIGSGSASRLPRRCAPVLPCHPWNKAQIKIQMYSKWYQARRSQATRDVKSCVTSTCCSCAESLSGVQFSYTPDRKLHILDRLAWSEMFESFLANKFAAAKRFGLEGCETLIPGMKALIDRSTDMGVDSIVMGMPHRGIFGLPHATIPTTLEAGSVSCFLPLFRKHGRSPATPGVHRLPQVQCCLNMGRRTYHRITCPFPGTVKHENCNQSQPWPAEAAHAEPLPPDMRNPVNLCRMHCLLQGG